DVGANAVAERHDEHVALLHCRMLIEIESLRPNGRLRIFRHIDDHERILDARSLKLDTNALANDRTRSIASDNVRRTPFATVGSRQRHAFRVCRRILDLLIPSELHACVFAMTQQNALDVRLSQVGRMRQHIWIRRRVRPLVHLVLAPESTLRRPYESCASNIPPEAGAHLLPELQCLAVIKNRATARTLTIFRACLQHGDWQPFCTQSKSSRQTDRPGTHDEHFSLST